MSMVFIFTLVIIGHLNTNNGRSTPGYGSTSFHQNQATPVTKITGRDHSGNTSDINQQASTDLKSGNEAGRDTQTLS